jgi:O-antigen/teichoic acid export membrane protein
VWGLAVAATFRLLVGAVCMTAISPAGFVRPRFHLAPLRPLLAFGVQYQAVGFVLVARGLGLTVGVGAIGGLALLGLWAIADRFLSVLALVVESLWRVSFPMMSRLIAAGEDPRQLIAPGTALVTFAIGFMASALVGAGPGLMSLLLGDKYAGAARVLPPACLSLVLAVPAGVVVVGYLYAQGRARAVLIPVVVHSLVWYVVAFALLPTVGIVAVGLGSLAGGVAGTFMLARAVDDIDVHALIAANWRPVLASIGAGGAGLAAGGPEGVLGLVFGGVAATGVYVATVFLLDRALLLRVKNVMLLAVRDVTGV